VADKPDKPDNEQKGVPLAKSIQDKLNKSLRAVEGLHHCLLPFGTSKPL
jgi:hypothetical protein